MSLPPRASLGEVYTAQLADDRYAACQVVGTHGEDVEIVGLNWIGDAPPTLDALAGVGPLTVHHHAHKPHIDRLNVEAIPPFWFSLVGQMPPIARFPGRCNAWSGWGAAVHHVLSQWRWDHEVPQGKRDAYQASRREGTVALDFAGKVHTLPARTWRLWLGPGAGGPSFSLQVDPHVKLDWSQLDQLGALAEIVYTGEDPAFADYLRTRWIDRAVWRSHSQGQIDLRGAALREFTLDAGDEPLLLQIDRVAELTVHGSARGLALEDPRQARGLRLRHNSPEVTATGIPGCEKLRWLGWRGLKDCACDALAAYPDLVSLSLVGAPGALRRVAALTELRALRRLSLRDFFEGELDQLPAAEEWAALDTFEVSGLPERLVTPLKERFEALRVLSIKSPRDAAWIAANL